MSDVTFRYVWAAKPFPSDRRRPSCRGRAEAGGVDAWEVISLPRRKWPLQESEVQRGFDFRAPRPSLRCHRSEPLRAHSQLQRVSAGREWMPPPTPRPRPLLCSNCRRHGSVISQHNHAKQTWHADAWSDVQLKSVHIGQRTAEASESRR